MGSPKNCLLVVRMEQPISTAVVSLVVKLITSTPWNESLEPKYLQYQSGCDNVDKCNKIITRTLQRKMLHWRCQLL